MPEPCGSHWSFHKDCPRCRMSQQSTDIAATRVAAERTAVIAAQSARAAELERLGREPVRSTLGERLLGRSLVLVGILLSAGLVLSVVGSVLSVALQVAFYVGVPVLIIYLVARSRRRRGGGGTDPS